jgi:nitrogen fixation/metabolism regulation signal transduction histidine kinase
MNSQRRKFWVDPPLQIHLVTVVLALVCGSVALMSYSVIHGLAEASEATHELFHSREWMLQAARGPLAIGGAISILASALLALAWSHRFAGPLRVLSGAMERLSQGDFSTPVRIRSSDTHHELVEEFGRMQAGLRYRLEGDILALTESSARLAECLDGLAQNPAAHEAAQAVIAASNAMTERYRL